MLINSSPTHKRPYYSFPGAVGSAYQLASGHWIPAKMSMTVVHPRPDAEITTIARQQYAFSDGTMEYRCPIVIQGGAPPFYVSTSSGLPSGMTISSNLYSTGFTYNPDYLVAKWIPTAGDTATYNCSVTIKDQDGLTIVVTWTVTGVTDTGATFIFVDPTAVTDGTGTKASPYNNTLSALGPNDASAINANKIMVFRAGTTTMQGTFGGTSTNINLTNKPYIWLGYTGEDCILDCTSCKVLVDAFDDVYMGGLHFKNARTDVTDANFVFFSTSSAGNRAGFFENTFDNIAYLSGGDTNQAAVFFENPTTAIRNYVFMVGNTMLDWGASLVDTYAIKYGVFDRNAALAANQKAANTPYSGMFFKSDVQYISARYNTITGTFQQSAMSFYLQAQTFPNDQLEMCYNFAVNSDNTFPSISYAWQAAAGVNTTVNMYIYRNTANGAIGGNVNSLMQQVVSLENNIIIDDGSHMTAWNTNSSYKTVTLTNNLVGLTSDNIYDTNGDINTAYDTANPGVKYIQGKQLG